jgi:hypothetical protein
MATKYEEIKKKISDYSNTNDTDVIVYFGDITRDGYESLAVACTGRKLRKHVVMLMVTLGGDPNAAYRIARMLQEYYKTVSPKEVSASVRPRGTFSIYVDTLCKSAGTIVCLGADRLILSEKAELGPIDVQLRKQDEVGERTSGLTPIQAIQFLETQSVRLFKRHFTELRDPNDLGFSTKMAAGIATEMTVGLLTAIYQQLDPIRLAEVDRSLKISHDYGERLTHDSNLKEGAIEKLLAKYPSHGFVIDRKEASELFTKVEPPTKELVEIMEYFRPLSEWTIEQDQNLVVFVSDEPTPPAPSDPTAPPQADAPAPGGTPAPEAVI